jgi:hypothetical protein
LTSFAIEDICNQALRRIGYAPPIGQIYEGSRASRVAVEIYGQTRDAVLKMQDWPFARRYTALTANGQQAPQPWLYEYSWPSDCLKVRYVAGPIGTFPVLDPRPQQFTDYNDQRLTPAVKAILSNVSPAVLYYTGQITDISTWEPSAVEALVEELARRFSVSLNGSPDLLKAETELAGGAESNAAQSQVNYPMPAPVQMEGRR